MVVRDKKATCQRLIEAVGELLANDGFQSMGINAIARTANVDKVLIYRYFGGLDGLIKAYSEEGLYWPSAREIIGNDDTALRALSLEDMTVAIMQRFIHAVKKRPITLEVMLWEMVDRNPLTEAFVQVRVQVMESIYKQLGKPIADAPKELDINAIIACFGSAMIYLHLRAKQVKSFYGVDLQSDEGWQRVEVMLERMIRGGFHFAPDATG